MREQEHHLQVACVRWFDYCYPQYRLNLFAIPNGGQRNKVVAGKLKAEGVRSGVADLFLALPAGDCHGLYIEMKVKPNKQTENQKIFANIVRRAKYQYRVIYDFDEFQAIVEAWVEGYAIEP